MYKQFKRTEGVSTTDITGRLLKVAEFSMRKRNDDKLTYNTNVEPPK